VLLIGVDPGTKTGLAGWDKPLQKFEFIKTLKIHRAIQVVFDLWHLKRPIKVFVEDARLRVWFGKIKSEKEDRARLQGAGSIKRDCVIWEDFLTDYKIPFVMIPPKGNKTKLDANTFARMTGWKERTSEHSRDGGMLVFKR